LIATEKTIQVTQLIAIEKTLTTGNTMSRMTTSEIRRIFTDVVNQVTQTGERVIIRRRDRDIAAIVPIEDLKLIERIEDEIDIAEVKIILADNESPVPWEEAMMELGLEK